MALPRPVRAWLAARRWRPFPFQLEARYAWDEGRDGLIHSPTGTGKTLAAILGPACAALEGDDAGGALRVLWITPMRALARDTEGALGAFLHGIGLPWTVERRTGDTGTAARARQRRRLPEVLVTTPESLALLLSYGDTAERLVQAGTVVADEWHELLGSKRGVLLELGLARLRRRRPDLRIWGLSATLGNLEEAGAVLVGPDRPPPVRIRGDAEKIVRVDSILPDAVERFSWGGHLGLGSLKGVVRALEDAGTTLLFTNTRFQAEAWFEALTRARPDWLGRIALHHGSLDREVRDRVEALLAEGELRCVVATSSLDLGVDFEPVEQVIQVGTPKGVARLLQRAGRSGHRPGAVSRVRCAPTHALDLLEYAAARHAIARGELEARRPLTGCLDVLAQHVVSLALAGPEPADALAREVRTAHAFSDLDDVRWRWVLDFVTRGGPALHAYEDYRRVVLRDGVLRKGPEKLARRHRMSIGTIASDGHLAVRWQNGGALGHVEEAFVARLRPGDCFTFGGRRLELVRVRDMAAWVRPAPPGRTLIPRWAGGRMPLSNALSASALGLLEAVHEGRAPEDPELGELAPLLAVQGAWSELPRRGVLVVEQLRTREGHHLFCYPFAGRLVHEGLASLLAWRLARRAPATFSLSANDHGLELVSATPFPLDEGTLRALLTTEDLLRDVLACINGAELARRRFREIARIAGLVFPGFPGAGKNARQLQTSSGLVYDVLREHDPDNALVAQALTEVLGAQLELDRLRRTLESLAVQRIVLTRPPRLTPFAFPLWVDRIEHRLSTEDWGARVERMRAGLERQAGAHGAAPE